MEFPGRPVERANGRSRLFLHLVDSIPRTRTRFTDIKIRVYQSVLWDGLCFNPVREMIYQSLKGLTINGRLSHSAFRACLCTFIALYILIDINIDCKYTQYNIRKCFSKFVCICFWSDKVTCMGRGHNKSNIRPVIGYSGPWFPQAFFWIRFINLGEWINSHSVCFIGKI